MKKILKFLRNLLWTVLILAMIAIASLEARIYFEVMRTVFRKQLTIGKKRRINRSE